MAHRPARDLREGDTVQDTYLLLEKELRQGTQGLYLHLVLGDRSGRVPARFWNATRELADGLAVGTLLQIAGDVRTFRQQVQINVTRAVPAPAGADLSEYLPHTACDVSAMWKDLSAAVGTVKQPAVRRILDAVLSDADIAGRLRQTPAATTHHHAHVGGLLEHIVSLCRLAAAVAPLYPALDRDLLLAGIVLHDIGKVEELSVSGGFRYTDAGKLVGHVGLGLALLERKAREAGNVPEDVLDQLRHLIASHHGRREWGALSEPATREAIALHYLDNLDAKMNAADSLLAEAAGQPGTWTEYARTFERALYKGKSSVQGPKS